MNIDWWTTSKWVSPSNSYFILFCRLINITMFMAGLWLMTVKLLEGQYHFQTFILKSLLQNLCLFVVCCCTFKDIILSIEYSQNTFFWIDYLDIHTVKTTPYNIMCSMVCSSVKCSEELFEMNWCLLLHSFWHRNIIHSYTRPYQLHNI